MPVFCDFDGTISIQDATDLILSRFAGPDWESIEEEWQQGAIGSAECMQRQVALIRATKEQLDAALDEIDIDPSFPAFVGFCRSRGIPLAVVSDGVDYFIHRILARHGLPQLPVTANHLTICGLNGHTRYYLASPFSEATCASAAGMCKCRSVGVASGIRVYVGDGRSDFCVATKPELLFAKGHLAAFCERENIPFMPYRHFADIAHAFKRRMPALLHPSSAAPTRTFA
jgi:2-hydroxy-3-keto-5-methylthiopentenyl-1-phosphate phosphatase